MPGERASQQDPRRDGEPDLRPQEDRPARSLASMNVDPNNVPAKSATSPVRPVRPTAAGDPVSSQTWT